MPPSRIIIDTDPGVDDVIAMLLALAATPEELEVLLISVTYGNVQVERYVKFSAAKASDSRCFLSSYSERESDISFLAVSGMLSLSSTSSKKNGSGADKTDCQKALIRSEK